MNRHLRDLQRGLDEILTMTPGAQHVVAECQRALDALKPRKAPAKRLSQPSRAEAREERRRRHRAETKAIRETRMRIAGGQCEVEVPFGNASDGSPAGYRRCYQNADEMHHTLSGSGRRRQQQAVENVRMICWHHHRAIDRGEEVEFVGLSAVVAAHRASKRERT